MNPVHVAFALILALPSIPLLTPAASACTTGIYAPGPDALVSVCQRWFTPEMCTGGVPLDATVGRITLTDGWVDGCSLWLDVLP